MKHTMVHLLKALFKQYISFFLEFYIVTDNMIQSVQSTTTETCGHTLGASIVMFGVSLVGQHHIGRGIEGDMVEAAVDVLLPCVHVDRRGVARHLQRALPRVVVGVIAVIVLVGHGIEAVGCANAALARKSK